MDDARLRTILSTSPTVAVLGIRDDPSAAGFYVAEYLHDVGYRVLGVNLFGVINSQVGNPRLIQFALKYSF